MLCASAESGLGFYLIFHTLWIFLVICSRDGREREAREKERIGRTEGGRERGREGERQTEARCYVVARKNQENKRGLHAFR